MSGEPPLRPVVVLGLMVCLALAVPAGAARYYGDVSFADTAHGAVVRDRQVLVTGDAGASWRRVAGERTWRVIANPTGPWFRTTAHAIYRGSATAERWPEVARFTGSLYAFTARGTGAWAVTQPRGGAMRLWHSFDAGRTWYFRSLPRAGIFDKGYPQLSFTNAADGAVAYPLPRGYAVRTTHDGGHTWSPPVDSCGRFGLRGVMSAVPAAIWMGCATSPALGNQGHRIAVSEDGGQYFRVRSQGMFPGEPHERNVGTIGSYGYLYSLVAASPSVAYAEMYRRGLLRTRDGGMHWRRVFSRGDGTGLAGVSVVGDRVWHTELLSGLYASSNAGATWHRVAIP